MREVRGTISSKPTESIKEAKLTYNAAVYTSNYLTSQCTRTHLSSKNLDRSFKGSVVPYSHETKVRKARLMRYTEVEWKEK